MEQLPFNDPEELVRKRLDTLKDEGRRDRLFTDAQATALEHLIRIAKQDTHQSQRVANFLLAWWNGAECGGFDLVDAWGLDRHLVTDMITVFEFIVRCHQYPDTLGYSDDFVEIVRRWRPALAEPSSRKDHGAGADGGTKKG